MSPEQVSFLPNSVHKPAEFGTEWTANGPWDDGRGQSRPANPQGEQLRASQTYASQSQASQEETFGAWHLPDADRSLEVSAVFDVCPPEVRVDSSGRSGGDFADVISLRGDWVALVLGDVCGKGPAAALCVPQTLYALRQILSGPINDCIDPSCILNQLNRHLCSSAPPAACASAALALIIMDTGTGEVLSACAGSEPPLILRAGGQAETVDAGRIALEVDAGRTYHTVDFRLGRGDALLLATDGITRAQRADRDKVDRDKVDRDKVDRDGGEHFLNYEELTALALNAFGMGSPSGGVARAVLSGARSFAGGSFQDHATVLVAARR